MTGWFMAVKNEVCMRDPDLVGLGIAPERGFLTDLQFRAGTD